MKLKHSSLKNTKTVSSVGTINIDATGHAEVTEEQAKLLVKCGFSHVHEEAPTPPLPPPAVVEVQPADSQKCESVEMPPAPPPPPPAVAPVKAKGKPTKK